MTVNMYSLKDTVIGEFVFPVAAHNDQDAIRLARLSCRPENKDLYSKARDMQLFKIGSFDSVTGKVNSDVKHLFNLCECFKEVDGE